MGVKVLSPVSTVVSSEQEGFVFFENEPLDPTFVESRHLDAIAKSDFVFVVNPDGYIGPSATMEIGYATARGKPVYAMSLPQEQVLRPLVTVCNDLHEIVVGLKTRSVELSPELGLSAIQRYISIKVRERGFGDESIRDVVLLLVEEVGELAKATRKAGGLMVGDTNKTVSSEIADCLIYLCDIANLAGVSLDESLRLKEAENNNRSWKKYG